MIFHEAHVERLLGKKVRDVNGEVVGRLEEIVAETIDGELVVVEYHLGAAAVLERIGVFFSALPYFGLIPFPKHLYRVRWDEMDLSEPNRPRVRRAKAELREQRKSQS